MKNKVVDLLEQNIEGMSHDELSQLVKFLPKQRWAISHFPAFVSRKSTAKPLR